MPHSFARLKSAEPRMLTASASPALPEPSETHLAGHTATRALQTHFPAPSVPLFVRIVL
jgi:hypothetical protein